MTDEILQTKTEGEKAFPVEEKETDNSTDSQSEETTEETPAGEGDKDTHQEDDDKLPFHKHPRWKQREDEWKKTFNESETRHQEELKKIREEFTPKEQSSEVPDWFGGDEVAWKKYQAYEDKVKQEAEDRAFKRLSESKQKEESAMKEATDYMESEMAQIESDKEFNPTGEKVDPNKLLKFVLDNDIVDSKGRWNYRVGWKLMRNQPKPSNRKGLAGATTSEAKPEEKPSAFKTSADFKKDRPW